MEGSVFLDGDSIDLRTIEREDVEFLSKHRNLPELREPLMLGGPENLEETESWFQETVVRGDSINLLITTDEHRVGAVHLFGVNEQSGHTKIAIWVHPEEQGNGYATEAASLMTTYAFDQLRMHRVVAEALESNQASCELWEKLGYTKEGVRRDDSFVNGEYENTVVYAVLEDEWEKA